MSEVRRARGVARAAAYGGGGLGAAGAVAFGLLATQAQIARKVVGNPLDTAPDGDGTYGTGRGRPLELAVVGDSSAVGLGVEHAWETPGAVMAAGLADLAHRRVRVRTVAVVGATSLQLGEQVDRLLAEGPRPEAVIVMIGANDVTKRIRPAAAVAVLEVQVARLVDIGAKVVVGTCPDLGAIKPIGPPLRNVARAYGRSLAAAQTIGVIAAGGRTVSLGDLLGPEFCSHPGELFSADRFHPNAAGYRRACDVLLPSMAAALGLVEDHSDRVSAPLPFGEGLDEVAHAAVRASRRAGTEVSPAPGRWAMLRRRRRASATEPGDITLGTGEIADAASVTSGDDGSGSGATYGGRSKSGPGQLTRP